MRFLCYEPSQRTVGKPCVAALATCACCPSRSGAVRFGQQPGSFTARRCRLSYGVSIYRRWTEEHEQHRQAHGYPTKDVRPEDGTEHAGAFVGRLNP